MILFDIDFTLVFGKDAFVYYKQYPRMFEKTLAQLLGVDPKNAKKIANDHRIRFNGQEEKAFETYKLDLSHWHEVMSSFSVGALKPLSRVQKMLIAFKDADYILGAITDGPKSQAEKILKAVDIDKTLFTVFIGWDRGKKLPKGGRPDVYKKILKLYSLQPQEVLMVGDSLISDILPAHNCGMHVLHITLKKGSRHPNAKSVYDLPNYLKSLTV